MTEDDPIVIYLSSRCPACRQLKAMVEAGLAVSAADLASKPNVIIVDVASKEFQAEKKALKRVPTAFRGTEESLLKLDLGTKDTPKNLLVIECPGDPVYTVEYDVPVEDLPEDLRK